MLGLGVLGPLGFHLVQAATGRELRRASALASVAALIGGYTLRSVLVLAGKASAERPTDYFRIAQADHVDTLTDQDPADRG